MTNDKIQMTKEMESTKSEILQKVAKSAKGDGPRGATVPTSGGFFGSEERVLALRAEAESWVGTRFQGHARVKGAGVDCVQLAAGIYVATGFLREFEVGWYPIDGGHHDEKSRVVEWIEKSGAFERVGIQQKVAKDAKMTEPPAAGDLIVMKLGRVEHHVGVALGGGLFVHVLYKATVCQESLGRFWKQVTAVYRPLAVRSAAALQLQHLRD
jgi:cell wall-associated NlpC family hydrolase